MLLYLVRIKEENFFVVEMCYNAFEYEFSSMKPCWLVQQFATSGTDEIFSGIFSLSLLLGDAHLYERMLLMVDITSMLFILLYECVALY